MTDVVTDLVHHAVGYAGMNDEAGAAFVNKVKAATAAELGSGATPPCVVVIGAADGELSVTFGSQTISQQISA